MPLLPVADVLLIERRTCRCGAIHETVSPARYRLFKACAGEPDKTEIRALKDFPERESELPDIRPMSERSIAYHDTSVPWCAACFRETIPIAEARAIRPPAPAQLLGTTMSTAWTKAQSAATGKPAKDKPRIVPLTIEEL